MVSLIQHVEKLKKYCNDRPELILWSILHNRKKMDEDTLVVYAINETPHGNEIVVIWASGNKEKIKEWVTDISIKERCKTITCVTQRWKGLCRMFNMKPTGVMIEREGFI